MDSAPRILIAGAGALGSVFGAKLRAAGHGVTLLGRPSHLTAIERNGLRISGLLGDSTATGFDLVDSPASLTGCFDLILFIVKSYDTASLGPLLRDRLGEDGLLVSLQNGLGNIEELIRHFGAACVLGGRVIFGAAMFPGESRVTVFADAVAIGPAPSIHGALSPVLHQRASDIASMIDRAGVPTVAVTDVMTPIWTKLLYNAALNPLGALLELNYGALGDDLALRRIMDRVIDEAFAVACRLGVTLPFANADEYRDTFYQKLLPSTYDHYPTMLHDLRSRGRTEIDSLNGRIVATADELRLDAEMNRTLAGLIRAGEKIRAASLGSSDSK